MDEFWGYHLMLDCSNGDTSASTDDNVLYEFVGELVSAIDMKAYGEPLIKHFAVESEKAAGYSLVQLIETSAITGHFSDITGDFYLDIFSCKEFDINIAQAVVRQYFKPETIKVTFLTRQA